MAAMAAFHSRCPEVGADEYRSIILPNGDGALPAGEYGFLELYCDELDCDCRRVLIMVLAPNVGKGVLATFSFGWESEEFYRQASPDYPDALPMAGLSIEPLGQQTKYTPALFEHFKWVLGDPAYVERLKRRTRATRPKHAKRSKRRRKRRRR